LTSNVMMLCLTLKRAVLKAMAARADLDRKDMEFLIGHLGITTAEEVFSIIEEYYPKRQIKPATQFAVEELFEV